MKELANILQDQECYNLIRNSSKINNNTSLINIRKLIKNLYTHMRARI